MLALLVATVATAGTWLAGDMADAGERPRLLVQAGEEPWILEHLDREPYLSLVSQTQTRCDRSADLSDMDVGPVQTRANTARACAWLFYLDRTATGGEVRPFADEAERRALLPWAWPPWP